MKNKGIISSHRAAKVSSMQASMEKWGLRELRQNCVSRGMPFEECLEGTVLSIQSWFMNNHMNPVDKQLLEQYDAWVNSSLIERNVDPIMLHNCFNLSEVIDEDSPVQIIKTKSSSPVREKINDGAISIAAGTKKAFTYECVKAGLSKPDTIVKVISKFPEANESSISIWYNKFTKALK